MITIKEVAALAGVSPSTVSAILNRRLRVKPETYDRVMSAIKELDYQPNNMARSLRTKETKTVGLLIPSIDNNAYAVRVKGVEDCALAHGYQVFICNTDRSPARERRELQALIGKCVDAILITTLTSEYPNVELMRSCGIPVISNTHEPALDFVDEVYTDYRDMARTCISYALSMGHRRIALVNGPRIYGRCIERHRGYCEAFREHGLPVDDSLLYFMDFTKQSAYELAVRLFSGKDYPSFFLTTSEMALGILNAAYDCGLRVPEDVSVIAWADSVDVRPRLTVVDEPNYLIGCTMMELAIRRIISGKSLPKQSLMIPSQLVLRDSVADRNKLL